jgi:hypothetical protein
VRLWCLSGILLVSLLAPAAYSLEGAPPLNAEKYPQDTPKNALNSILKALEKRDFDYWIVWLIIPDDTKKLIDKHGSLAAVSLMNADDKHTPRIKRQIDAITQMLKIDKMTEGVENGVTYVRYHDDKKILQMEKQPDGRWSMNICRSNELAKEEAAKKAAADAAAAPKEDKK